MNGTKRFFVRRSKRPWLAACSRILAPITVVGLALSVCAKPQPQPPPANVIPVKTAEVAAMLNAAAGRVVVVNLWATWCPPCVAEMPHFVSLLRAYSPDKVAFFSLSADAPDMIDSVVAPFHKRYQLPFPVHVLEDRDPDALGKVLHAELSGALPVSLLYDRNGKLVKTWDSAITIEELIAAIEPLL